MGRQLITFKMSHLQKTADQFLTLISTTDYLAIAIIILTVMVASYIIVS